MSHEPPNGANLTGAIQALLHASPVPLTVARLAALTGSSRHDVETALAAIRNFYAGGPGGVGMQELGDGWQLTTDPSYGETVAELIRTRPQPLSPAALETLAIIAYRQPVTRAEIEAIRGVSADGVTVTLVERGLIREAGRRPGPGRPVLYATTDEFLRLIGLRSVADLPEPEAADDGPSDDLPLLPG